MSHFLFSNYFGYRSGCSNSVTKPPITLNGKWPKPLNSLSLRLGYKERGKKYEATDSEVETQPISKYKFMKTRMTI